MNKNAKHDSASVCKHACMCMQTCNVCMYVWNMHVCVYADMHICVYTKRTHTVCFLDHAPVAQRAEMHHRPKKERVWALLNIWHKLNRLISNDIVVTWHNIKWHEAFSAASHASDAWQVSGSHLVFGFWFGCCISFPARQIYNHMAGMHQHIDWASTPLAPRQWMPCTCT